MDGRVPPGRQETGLHKLSDAIPSASLTALTFAVAATKVRAV